MGDNERIRGLPIAEYHARDELSKHDLDQIHRSVSHFLVNRIMPHEETTAMRMGSATHAMILTPDEYEATYIHAPDVDRRTREGKDIWREFEEKARGKIIIGEKDMLCAAAMADAVLNHPIASRLLRDGEAENSLFWKDKTSGIRCKCRPDYLRVDGLVVDLKTTADASEYAFLKSVLRYRYHVQAALYLAGVEAVEGKVDDFVIVAVEKEEPYAVAIYRLDEFFLADGKRLYEDALAKYAEYLNHPDPWAGYPKEIQELHLPGWA